MKPITAQGPLALWEQKDTNSDQVKGVRSCILHQWKVRFFFALTTVPSLRSVMKNHFKVIFCCYICMAESFFQRN